MSKIIISGSHSTGKTTLVNELKKAFPIMKILPETARKVITKINILPIEAEKDINKKLILQREILKNQIGIEQKNKEVSYIGDRGIFDPLAYCFDLKKKDRDEMLDTGLKHYLQNPYSHIFFLLPVLEVEDDGTRILDKNFQLKISKEIENLYRKFKVKYIKIKTISLEERISLVKKIIEKDE